MPTLASTQAASSEDGDATTIETVCFSPDGWGSLINGHAGEGQLIREIWLRRRPARVYVEGEQRWLEILDLEAAANRAMTEYKPSVELDDYSRDRLTVVDLAGCDLVHALGAAGQEGAKREGACLVKEKLATSAGRAKSAEPCG
ncbi:hypothetical protein B0T17DRAFT_511785 [Bombardia bombarda]|uniref:Uncharacterized protein n=1 Tax=Bombardia bombarda TaxID=252184 RepID=A0AA39TZG0_9PEZI|nr:hypothetical protein B0T17DRAFT_511785 [Bombardia bombarda]